MQTNQKLTTFSHIELNHLTNANFSPADAYQYISQDLKVRTFSETLSIYYDGDIKDRLIAGLCRIETHISPDSVTRKVRNWLSGKHQPTERVDLIKICFALGLDESKANGLLSMSGDGGFHLRNPEELAYAYCLRTGKSYDAAAKLIADLKPLGSEAGKSFAMTKIVAEAFQNVWDDESFHRFYREQYNNLGRLRNTAYSRFLFFLDLLIRPSVPLYVEPEPKYTVDDVVETYLRMNLPLDKRTAKLSMVQKTIKRYWPNATSIVRMRGREEDVTRRVLLLLYLITEGANPDDGGEDVYDDPMTERERFEEDYWRVNSMLHDCGMSRLDPRNIFDWLVLYCLKAGENEAMSERLQGVLSIVFETETT
jgi:hypothetical protein